MTDEEVEVVARAIPHLTNTRWAYLCALKASKALQSRPFLASELVTLRVGGERGFRATGATMASLRDAGWLESVPLDAGGSGSPFRMGRMAQAWRLTEAGRAAIAACPDTFPGPPVYEDDTP